MAARARARWLMAFFSAAGISPRVRVSPSSGLEDRVVAVAVLAAHGPDDAAFDAALEHLLVVIRPEEHEGGAEAGGAGFGRVAGFQFVPGAFHGAVKVAAIGRFGPIGGVDAGRAAERVDLDAGIVGQRGEAGGLDGGAGLDARVADEAVLGLLGLRQVEVAVRQAGDAVGREEGAELVELAQVMGRDQELLAVEPPHAMADFWAATSVAVPASARSRRASNSAREKVEPSALACISIIRPAPVMTKLPSVPASLSSG